MRHDCLLVQESSGSIQEIFDMHKRLQLKY